MMNEEMRRKLIILGTGGNCMDILEAVREINASAAEGLYECAGFLDDDAEKRGREYCGVKVLGPVDAAPQYADCFFVNGIGSPANFWRKKDIIARTGLPPDRFEAVIHPSASVSPTAQVGRGSVVLQNVAVASNAVIGNHVIILPNSVIGHGDVIGDYTCIAGGACIAGGVAVGESCYLGANSTIRGNTRIGDRCLVGMGSVVLGSVDANSVVVGNPARYLRKTMDEQA